MQEHLEPARRQAWPALMAIVIIAVGGCSLEIENKKGGADLCTPNPCQGKGVCGDWTGTCTVKNNNAECSGWKAKAGVNAKDADGNPLTAPAGFEQNETLCDGLDNDCDGLVDESAVGDPAKECSALAVGACAGLTQSLTCIGGSWRCEWPVGAAVEATETLCDGVDNDCDGETDEGVAASATTCKRMGVCAGLEAPTCTAGAWDCHYDAAPDYEEVTETKCDGKDNNCDGLVDSALGALADGATCNKSGVCGDSVNIICLGGKAVCDYAAVDGWQLVESQCDGKDNDCDGTVDNLAGSKLPLTDGNITDCAKEGVCQAHSDKVARLCVGGAFTCNYSGVLGWEAAETQCDGLDNDCDGKVDGDLSLPGGAPSPCGSEGVCSQGKAICATGIWTCDWAALAKDQGWEAMEATCDGKDNDCDGQVDEDSSALGANKCLAKGVCQWGTAVQCGGGTPTCQYDHVLGYQEATETSCDGLDNDCDGDVDEAEGLDLAQSGCSLGVCKDKAKATCASGKWNCIFDGIDDYEGKELSCDGKDNDCDGDVDEGLTDTTAAKCLTKGLCSAGVSAMCTGGKYVCSYPTGYEADEKSCDSKDNDCDGYVDEKACAAGAGCDKNDVCATGSCVTLLGSANQVCTAKAGQCATLAGDGGTTFTDSGATACIDDGSTSKCAAGTWGTASKCAVETPTCHEGECLKCTPNKLACVTTFVGSKVVQCNKDGSASTNVKNCDGGTKCVGSGVCVADSPFTVGDGKSSENEPEVAQMGDGFVIAWNGGGVFAQRYDGAGKKVGAAIQVSETKAPEDNQRLALAASDAGFAVAWVTKSQNDGQEIALRLFDKTGKALAASSLANSIQAEDQSEPTLGAWSGGWVVAWTHQTPDQNSGGNIKNIAARLYDASGKAAAIEFIANKAVDQNDDSEAGDQDQPALACRADGSFALAWRHDPGSSSASIKGRVFDKAGATKTGNMLLASDDNNKKREPALAWSGNNLIAAWVYADTDPQANKGDEIKSGRFDATLKALAAIQTANVISKGAQTHPAAAGDGAGGVSLVWTTQGDSSGSDVASRDVRDNGAFSPLTTEATLFNSPPPGEQDQPAVVKFADGRIVVVWRHRTKEGDKGVITATFR